MNIEIKPIHFEETYPIRQVVLRPNLPKSTCFFEGDQEDTTFHFGLFETNILVGIISLFKNNHDYFSEINQYQIRGMAVLPEYQKLGFGQKLVEYSQNYLKQKNTDLIWFNAREKAVGFYSKIGYRVFGEAFEIPTVGTHYVMYKHNVVKE